MGTTEEVSFTMPTHLHPLDPASAFLLITIVERLATLPARISRKRAKELRDNAAYDRERELIERSQTGSDDGSGI